MIDIKKIFFSVIVLGIIFSTIVFGLESTAENSPSSNTVNQNFTLYQFPKKAVAEATEGPFYEFSPLDPKIIWVKHRDLSYQFDTDSKQWSSLEPILGSFAGEISGITKIVKDPYDPRLIWVDDNNGILIYNKETKQNNILNPELTPAQKETQAARFNTFTFAKDFVWLGAFNGLYCYHRNINRISQIPAFKNIEVDYISLEDTGRIWVNQEFCYDPQTQKVFQVYEIPGWPIKKVATLLLVNGYKFFQSPVVVLNPSDKVVETVNGSNKLRVIGTDVYLLINNSVSAKFDYNQDKFIPVPAGTGEFSPGDLNNYARGRYITDDFIYFKGEYGLYRLNKSTQEQTVFKLQRSSDFVAKGNDLWLLVNDGIIHIDLADCNDDFVPLAEITAEYDRISDMYMAIDDETDFIIRIQKIAQFFNYINEHPNAYGDSYFERFLPYQRAHDQEEINAIQQFLTEEITPLEKELSYFSLIQIPIQLEKPELAFQYYNALKTEFPHSTLLQYFSVADVQKLKENCRLTLIKKMPKSREDEKLWLLGLFFMENAPLSENLPNLSYANKYFNELIRKYPQSKWADDAAFNFITDNDFHDDGDYTNPECVKKLQDFIKKYPNSEFVPNAKLKIASHYFLYADLSNGFSDPKIFTYLNNAKKLCGEALNSKTDSDTKKNASATLQRINKLLESHPWALEMKLNASSYQIGAPVVINFKLKNMSSKDKKISINTSLPNFGVWISRDTFGSETARDSLVMTVKIFPGKIQKATRNIPANGGEYNEQVTLQKAAVSPKSGYVRYVINEPGTYTITGFCRPSTDQPVNTKQIRIIVRK